VSDNYPPSICGVWSGLAWGLKNPSLVAMVQLDWDCLAKLAVDMSAERAEVRHSFGNNPRSHELLQNHKSEDMMILED